MHSDKATQTYLPVSGHRAGHFFHVTMVHVMTMCHIHAMTWCGVVHDVFTAVLVAGSLSTISS